MSEQNNFNRIWKRCPYCGTIFSSDDELREHLVLHTRGILPSLVRKNREAESELDFDDEDEMGLEENWQEDGRHV